MEFIVAILFIIHHDSYVVTFWILYLLLTIFHGEIKLTTIVSWIFHVSDFLSLFISFKYDLTLLRCSLTNSVLFLSPFLLDAILLLLQKSITLTGLDQFSSSFSKTILISLSIISLIALFSFSRVKKFLIFSKHSVFTGFIFFF